MKSNHLEKYESSHSKHIDLYKGGFWEYITGTFLQKIFDLEEHDQFDFDRLNRVGEEYTHEGQSNFHQSVLHSIEEHPESFDYLTSLKATIMYDLNLLRIGRVFAILAQIPVPTVLESYLNWLADEDAEPTRGFLLLFAACLLCFLQFFCVQFVWINYSRLTAIVDLLNKVVSMLRFRT